MDTYVLNLASDLSPSMREHLLGEPRDHPAGRSYCPHDRRTVGALVSRGLAHHLINDQWPEANWMWEPTDLGIAVEMVLRNMDVPAHPADRCRSCGQTATSIHYPMPRPGPRREFTPRAYGTCDAHAAAAGSTSYLPEQP